MKRAYIKLYIDPEAYASGSGQGELTQNRLYEYGHQVNEDATGIFGYEAWEAGFEEINQSSKIEERLWQDGVDYVAKGGQRIRAGVERGQIWVTHLSQATVEDAGVLVECVQRAIAYKKGIDT